MKKAFVVGAIFVAVAVAGFVYLADDSREESSSHAPPASDARSAGQPTPGERQSAVRDPVAPSAVATSQPSDPRLAALSVSLDNGLIEFVPGADGKIIKEIDKDPNSPGYRKPLREYTYAGGNVIGMVAYQYFSDHVQITRTQVMYKPDGSVDQYSESTSYDYGNKGPGAAR